MKNGLIKEQEHLVYYKNDRPYHAGVVQVDGDIYYISSKGRAIKGVHIVHGEMANGILKRGTYTFGDDYKLVPDSYIPPRKKKKKIFRNWRKWAPAVCLALVGLLVILALVKHFQDQQKVKPKETKISSTVTPEGADSDIRLPKFEENVLLCSKSAHQMYLDNLPVEDAVDAGTAYRSFIFEYDLGDADGTLVISEADDATKTRVFDLPPQYTSISVENLKTGTTYDYEVRVNGQVYEGSFTTEASTRFITIPGVENTRDIGGYINEDGRMIKQGMIIRGSELDGLVVPGYFLNVEDADEVQEVFGFAYEMDLRGGNIYGGVYQSRLGANVGHYFYGSPQYGEIFNRNYQPALREIFADLADPNKYPMYLHCTYGADRTGTVVFLLQGILNMSQEDMVREYKMTGFETASYRKSEKMDIVIHGLEAYEGDTLQEKIVSFLVQEVGVTYEQIESIRNIMLE